MQTTVHHAGRMLRSYCKLKFLNFAAVVGSLVHTSQRCAAGARPADHAFKCRSRFSATNSTAARANGIYRTSCWLADPIWRGIVRSPSMSLHAVLVRAARPALSIERLKRFHQPGETCARSLPIAEHGKRHPIRVQTHMASKSLRNHWLLNIALSG